MDTEPKDFIRQAISDDISNEPGRSLVTRFPPEPNGYLHIGHAKSICLNFGVADEFAGRCFLRFDDTNPVNEDPRFAEAIQEDVRWLGFDWEDRLTHASDYFDQLYAWALLLIDQGDAFVDSSSAEEMRTLRGTLTEPGQPSPYRDRSPAENRALFEAMAAGEFPEGAHVLRAKIDMASGNLNLRDPALYRIRHVEHPRTGDRWHIYPMYDYAHTLSDALEGTTHSLCTLEFEDHRPLYEWFLAKLPVPNQPRQIEFSRLNLMFTVTSKRKLKALIDAGHVDGWDDPRMPTLAGMRRRGYPPAAIREFCHRVGITKKENTIELGALENCLRDELNATAPRRMAVLDPLKLTLTNFPEGETEWHTAANHPQHPELGTREIPLTRNLHIERSDFMEDPPRKFFRLKPGGEVRLRFGYIIRCDDIVKDDAGNVVELLCSLDPATRSGLPEANRKVKGTIHWVSADHSVAAQVFLYDRLFQVPSPTGDLDDLAEELNPASLEQVTAQVEPALGSVKSGDRVQFERLGYFVAASLQPLAFNRIVTLRDGWAKLEKQVKAQEK